MPLEGTDSSSFWQHHRCVAQTLRPEAPGTTSILLDGVDHTVLVKIDHFVPPERPTAELECRVKDEPNVRFGSKADISAAQSPCPHYPRKEISRSVIVIAAFVASSSSSVNAEPPGQACFTVSEGEYQGAYVNPKWTPAIRFGSLADIAACLRDVRSANPRRPLAASLSECLSFA